MTLTGDQTLTNSQLSGGWPGVRQGNGPRLGAPPPSRCRRAQRPDLAPHDARLAREDALREAAISLSLGDGVPITGREYRLLEQLWRTDP